MILKTSVVELVYGTQLQLPGAFFYVESVDHSNLDLLSHYASTLSRFMSGTTYTLPRQPPNQW